jgi:hypothetical protein
MAQLRSEILQILGIGHGVKADILDCLVYDDLLAAEGGSLFISHPLW